MVELFRIVAVVLFIIAAIIPRGYANGPGWLWNTFVASGLAFFAASFLDAVAKA